MILPSVCFVWDLSLKSHLIHFVIQNIVLNYSHYLSVFKIRNCTLAVFDVMMSLFKKLNIEHIKFCFYIWIWCFNLLFLLFHFFAHIFPFFGYRGSLSVDFCVLLTQTPLIFHSFLLFWCSEMIQPVVYASGSNLE